MGTRSAGEARRLAYKHHTRNCPILVNPFPICSPARSLARPPGGRTLVLPVTLQAFDDDVEGVLEAGVHGVVETDGYFADEGESEPIHVVND